MGDKAVVDIQSHAQFVHVQLVQTTRPDASVCLCNFADPVNNGLVFGPMGCYAHSVSFALRLDCCRCSVISERCMAVPCSAAGLPADADLMQEPEMGVFHVLLSFSTARKSTHPHNTTTEHSTGWGGGGGAAKLKLQHCSCLGADGS